MNPFSWFTGKPKAKAPPVAKHVGKPRSVKSTLAAGIGKENKSIADIVDEMNRDYQVRLGRLVIMANVASIDVQVVASSNDPRAMMLAHKKKQLWDASLPKMLESYDYGRVAFENCFEHDARSNLTFVQSLDALPYRETEMRISDDGDFEGIKLKVGDEKPVKLDADKSFWCAIDATAMEPHGKSQYIGAPWETFKKRKKTRERADTFFRRQAVGAGVVYYPETEEIEQGQRYDAGEVTLNALAGLEAGGWIGFPNNKHPTMDGEFEYKVDKLQEVLDSGPILATIAAEDIEQLRSMGIPEKTITEGDSVGSHAMVKQQTQALYALVDGLMAQLVNAFQRYVVDKSVELNFGASAGVSIKVMATKLVERPDSLLSQIMTTILGAAQLNPLLACGGVDFRSIFESGGLPVSEDFNQRVSAFIKQEEARVAAQPPSPFGHPGFPPRQPQQMGHDAGPVVDLAWEDSKHPRDHGKFAHVAGAAIDSMKKYRSDHPFGSIPFDEIHKDVSQGAHVSLGELHDVLNHLADTGHAVLHPFTQAAYVLKNGDFGIPRGQEIKFYVDSTGKPEPVDTSEVRHASPKAIEKFKQGLVRDLESNPGLHHLGEGPADHAATHGLTHGQAEDAVRELHAAGHIQLHPWTRPAHEMRNERHGLIHDGQIVLHVSHGGKTLAAGFDDDVIDLAWERESNGRFAKKGTGQTSEHVKAASAKHGVSTQHIESAVDTVRAIHKAEHAQATQINAMARRMTGVHAGTIKESHKATTKFQAAAEKLAAKFPEHFEGRPAVDVLHDTIKAGVPKLLGPNHPEVIAESIKLAHAHRKADALPDGDHFGERHGFDKAVEKPKETEKELHARVMPEVMKHLADKFQKGQSTSLKDAFENIGKKHGMTEDQFNVMTEAGGLGAAAATVPSATPKPPEQRLLDPKWEAEFKKHFESLHKASPLGLVPLHELRKKFPDLSKEEFDRHLKPLRQASKVLLNPFEGRHGSTQEERDSFIHANGAVYGHVTKGPKYSEMASPSPVQQQGKSGGKAAKTKKAFPAHPPADKVYAHLSNLYKRAGKGATNSAEIAHAFSNPALRKLKMFELQKLAKELDAASKGIGKEALIERMRVMVTNRAGSLLRTEL